MTQLTSKSPIVKRVAGNESAGGKSGLSICTQDDVQHIIQLSIFVKLREIGFDFFFLLVLVAFCRNDAQFVCKYIFQMLGRLYDWSWSREWVGEEKSK